MVSELDRCKRFLVSVILALGRTYQFAINIARDSDDPVVKRAGGGSLAKAPAPTGNANVSLN